MADTSSKLDIPDSIAALLPDVVESSKIPPKAQQAVREMEDDQNNRAAKMVEAAKNIPTAKVALNGIFRHPPEFTEEEWDIIIAGLKAHLPLYSIAMKVNCERHFLARKIQENQEVVQVRLDAREGANDEMEYQLFKAARAGSMSAIIYWLDHQGRDRGWGEQEERKEKTDDVQIVFGEISDKDLEEGKRLVAEAQKRTTPTLAAELAELEIPKQATAHDLAIAEDMVKSIEKSSGSPSEEKVTDIPPQSVSEPPYAANQGMSDERFHFLENAFSEGGDSPFGGFE